MRLIVLYRIAFIVLFLLLFTNALEAADKVVSKEFITEPQTLISLGFEWQIDGDDNRNAEVAISYRRNGDQIPESSLNRMILISGSVQARPLRMQGFGFPM